MCEALDFFEIVFLSLVSNLYDTKLNCLNLKRMKNLSSGLRRWVLGHNNIDCGLCPSRQLLLWSSHSLLLPSPLSKLLLEELKGFHLGEGCPHGDALLSLT